MEALACVTPLVATPMGAVSEIIDDGVTGFIRSGEDSLAEAVRAAADLDREACRRVEEVVPHRISALPLVADRE